MAKFNVIPKSAQKKIVTDEGTIIDYSEEAMLRDANEVGTNYKLPDVLVNTSAPEPIPNTTSIPTPTISDAATSELKSTQIRDIEHAVSTLKQAFPEFIRNAIQSYADMMHVNEWQFVCGIIARAYQTSSFSQSLIDPAWLTASPLIEPKATCKKCGIVFVPRWRNQQYCCNECGYKESDRRHLGSVAANG